MHVIGVCSSAYTFFTYVILIIKTNYKHSIWSTVIISLSVCLLDQALIPNIYCIGFC